MHLAQIEEKCKDLESKETEFQEKLQNISDLEMQAKRKEEEEEIARMIAELRGEQMEVGYGLEELKQAREVRETLRGEIDELKEEILNGLTELKLPILRDYKGVKIDAEGSCVIPLEEGPYELSVKFISSLFNIDPPLELDRTSIYPDRFLLTQLTGRMDPWNRLIAFRDNIARMARIALGESDPEVEKVVDHLYQSVYREVWEAVRGRRRILYENLYSELGVTDPKEKKTRVQNFFTNERKNLKELFPYRNIGRGAWEQSFFGSLVWRRYQDKYIDLGESDESRERTIEVSEIERGKTESTSTILNKYITSNNVKEIIYGPKGV